MEENEGEKLYTWETEYERTWEALKEDVDGHLQTETDELAYKIKRRRLFDYPKNMRLGMTRHMFVIVDGSSTMLDKDLRPDRLTCTIKVLEKFILEFFDQNPVSQLGLIVTKNGRAEKLVELSGNSRHLTSALQKITCNGEPSLQNSLNMATSILRNVPSYASKEILVIMAALTSCDPGNIFDTVEELAKLSVKCSIIGLAAELKLCKTIAQRTQGTYSVVLDESHYRDLLLQHTRPPTAKETLEASLIKMGFPHHVLIGDPSACMCHLDQRSAEYIKPSGYFCPQWFCKVEMLVDIDPRGSLDGSRAVS
eukprot:Em0008g944a